MVLKTKLIRFVCHQGNRCSTLWGKEFVDRCFEDENRFDRSIRRRTVKSFTAIATNTMIRGKDDKLLDLRSTRDLFGRLLYISI